MSDWQYNVTLSSLSTSLYKQEREAAYNLSRYTSIFYQAVFLLFRSLKFPELHLKLFPSPLLMDEKSCYLYSSTSKSPFTGTGDTKHNNDKLINREILGNYVINLINLQL